MASMDRRQLLALMPEIALAWQHAQHAAKAPPRVLKTLTKAEAATLDAALGRMIPADELGPGAREAGLLYFIDHALGSFARSDREAYRTGLAKLAGLDKLDAAAQDAALRAIETTPFFDKLRTHVCFGMFGNPEYGGNQDKAGWKLIGFDDAFVFTPPFGDYDRV